MYVYAHRQFVVDDMERHQTFRFAPGQYHDMRDALARQVVEAHPDTLCLIPEDEHPDQHKCKTGRQVALEQANARRTAQANYQHEMADEPEQDTMMRPRLSAQRRKLLKAARRRSGIARRNNPKT